MKLPDVFREAAATEHWQIDDASQIAESKDFECDVLIVGSGAGGATAAARLVEQGLTVMILEEGGLFTSQDFQLDEAQAYADLYQEGMTRSTSSGAIGILQGRAVGGSTLVNWTSSFRAPEQTLGHWQDHHQVKGLTPSDLRPSYERCEAELNIQAWQQPNANNAVLLKGCQQLGIEAHAIARNVKACWNLGYCGLGCPTNAKQSTLISYIPQALRKAARLFYRVRAKRLDWQKHKAQVLIAEALDSQGKKATGVELRFHARAFILAAGAIGTPSLLLRSKVPDPYQLIGKRSFLHPSVFVNARFAEKIEPYYGAPQSIYTDHYQWLDGVTGRMGFKIEAAPQQPMFASVIIRGHGALHRQRMEALPYTAASLALLRDGFHKDSPGGEVKIDAEGLPSLDYVGNDYLYEGVRRAMLAMGEIYFAAGAEAVFPAHPEAPDCRSWAEYQKVVKSLRLGDCRQRLGSAHAMGGMSMSEIPRLGPVNSRGKLHSLDNIWVWDGSVFPSSLGTNPQLTIYSLVTHWAETFSLG